MKIHLPLLAVASLLTLLSCNKNDVQPIQEGPRLEGYSVEYPSGDSDTTTIVYDASGQMIRTWIKFSAQNTQNVFGIQTSGNEVLMTEAVAGYLTGTDTIRLFLDGEGKLLKKIQHLWWQLDDAGFKPVTYQMDTIAYQYNSAGLMTKAVRSFHDSTWLLENGVETLSDQHLSATANYSNVNNNLASIISNGNWTRRRYAPSTSSDVTSRFTQNVTTSFEYTKDYQNKFDYGNSAIINTMSWLTSFPMDKRYQNVPDKMTVVDIQKDQNGAVVYTNTAITGFTFSYNADGLISSRVDSGGQGLKVGYVYGK